MDWKKVRKCKHKNLYENYNAWGQCGTPYCGTWDEFHCRDCGVYFTECACHSNEGMSGWSDMRWKRWMREKEREK